MAGALCSWPSDSQANMDDLNVSPIRLVRETSAWPCVINKVTLRFSFSRSSLRSADYPLSVSRDYIHISVSDPDPHQETLIWIRVPQKNRDKLAYKSTKIIKT